MNIIYEELLYLLNSRNNYPIKLVNKYDVDESYLERGKEPLYYDLRSEMQLMKFEENNIQIIGCSADTPIKQKKFCDRQNFQFPVLCDENHEILKAYGAWGKKKFMGREYMGISRMTYVIDKKGIIEMVYEKVKVKSHARDILNELVY